MNKIAILLIGGAFFFSNAKGQTVPKYSIGIEGWGSHDNYKNFNPDGSSFENTNLYFNYSVFAGKFITPKTLAFIFFTSNYSGNIYDNVEVNPTGNYYRYYYSVSLLPGIGIRKYFAFAQKDIVGLFLDMRLSSGISVHRGKENGTRDTISYKRQETKNQNLASINLSPCVYINLSPKWQLLLGVGNVFYTTLWAKNDGKVLDRTTFAVKGSAFGLNFNAQSFTLSAARFF